MPDRDRRKDCRRGCRLLPCRQRKGMSHFLLKLLMASLSETYVKGIGFTSQPVPSRRRRRRRREGTRPIKRSPPLAAQGRRSSFPATRAPRSCGSPSPLPRGHTKAIGWLDPFQPENASRDRVCDGRSKTSSRSHWCSVANGEACSEPPGDEEPKGRHRLRGGF